MTQNLVPVENPAFRKADDFSAPSFVDFRGKSEMFRKLEINEEFAAFENQNSFSDIITFS